MRVHTRLTQSRKSMLPSSVSRNFPYQTVSTSAALTGRQGCLLPFDSLPLRFHVYLAVLSPFAPEIHSILDPAFTNVLADARGLKCFFAFSPHTQSAGEGAAKRLIHWTIDLKRAMDTNSITRHSSL